MRGSLRERAPGVFELRVYLGKDAMSGAHRYKSVTFRGTKRDAETQLARLITDAQTARVTGRTVAPGKYKLNQLIETYLAEFQGSPTTLRSYRSQFSRYIEPAIGRLALEKVDTRLLGQFYAYLGEEKDLAPATVRRIHALVSSSLRHAVRWGWIGRNPATDAVVPRVDKYEAVVPTPDQVNDAVDEAIALDPEFGMLVRLAASTGARRGELCALRWGSVDLDDGLVRIEANVVPVEGGTFRKDTKNHSKRNVPLDDDAIEALRAHRRLMVDRVTACGGVLADDAYVFSGAADCMESWHPDSVSSKWARVRENCGLDGVRLHDLRHFQATMLLAAGIPVNNVSKRIGHRDASVTLNVYAHALESVDRRSAEVIGELLKRRPVDPAN